MLIFPREVKNVQHHSSPVLSTPCGRTFAKYLVVWRRRSLSSIYFFVCQFRQYACYIHDIHHSYIFASFMHSCIFSMFASKSFVQDISIPKKKRKKKRNRYGRVISPNRLSPISRKKL